MKSTFKLSFYIKKQSLTRIAKAPLCRVSGDLAEFSTKLTTTKNSWIPKVGKAKGNSSEIIDLNAALGAIEGVVNMLGRVLK